MRRLDMRSSTLPLVILSLGVIVALLGYAYTLWSETLQVNVEVNTGNNSVKVSDCPQIVLICTSHECCHDDKCCSNSSNEGVDDGHCCNEENTTNTGNCISCGECCKCKCIYTSMYVTSNTSVGFMIPKTKHSVEVWVMFKVENNGTIPLKYTSTTISSPYPLTIVNEYYYHVSENFMGCFEDYLDLDNCPKPYISGESLPIVFEPGEGVLIILHLKSLTHSGQGYWVTVNSEIVQWNRG